MRVDAPDLASAAGAATPSHYRPHPRYRSAATVVAGAGLLPTVTVNHLNQDASGTLSPPGSRTGLRWLRGGGKTSDCGGFRPVPSPISPRQTTYIANSCPPTSAILHCTNKASSPRPGFSAMHLVLRGIQHLYATTQSHHAKRVFRKSEERVPPNQTKNTYPPQT